MSFNGMQVVGNFVKKGTVQLISVTEAKMLMSNCGDTPFFLKFIAAENGDCRTIARGLYGGQKREKRFIPAVNQDNKPRKIASIKETGRIPLINLDAREGDQFRTVFGSHIIQYNEFQVKH